MKDTSLIPFTIGALLILFGVPGLIIIAVWCDEERYQIMFGIYSVFAFITGFALMIGSDPNGDE